MIFNRAYSIVSSKASLKTIVVKVYIFLNFDQSLSGEVYSRGRLDSYEELVPFDVWV